MKNGLKHKNNENAHNQLFDGFRLEADTVMWGGSERRSSGFRRRRIGHDVTARPFDPEEFRRDIAAVEGYGMLALVDVLRIVIGIGHQRFVDSGRPFQATGMAVERAGTGIAIR